MPIQYVPVKYHRDTNWKTSNCTRIFKKGYGKHQTLHQVLRRESERYRVITSPLVSEVCKLLESITRQNCLLPRKSLNTQ